MNQVNEKPVLMVTDGELRGQKWVMHSDALTIGRGGEADVVLPERQISRVHVRVVRHVNGYEVEDLDSKNGTHLNGEPLIGSHPLRDGDEIQIALAVKMRFVGSEATVPLDAEGITAGRLQLDTNTRQVSVGGQMLDPPLSLLQYRLLELLHEREGGVCSRDEVISIVWPEDESEGVSEQAIDAVVRRLRDRLAELDPDHQYVVTVRGHGFRLDPGLV
jgi:DNA-binding winged helix-turn-helix (wHTH) protein